MRVSASHIILALGTLFITNACSPKISETKKKMPGISWTESQTLTAAIEEAKLKGQLVFIDFYTEWCTPCKMMDQDVYSDLAIAKLFNQNFVNLKVDCEKGGGPNLALLYQVYAYPALVFVDHNGRVVVRKDGSAYHTELTNLANEAIRLGGAL